MTCFFCFLLTNAQHHEKKIKGMYIQWGYNKEWYSQSNIHFSLGNGDHFILHHTKASDKPDYDAIYKKPLEISIPQYNYRIGFYLNDKKSKAIELNFDHAKYVVTNFQKVHVSGNIEGQVVNGDSILNSATFLHLEHTDGANWLHFNYVQQKTILHAVHHQRPLLTLIKKIGAGINIPRTDFTWKGSRFNNYFHVAGYNISAESGFRYYFNNRLFLEGTGKTGYVRYINALANTREMKKSRVSHGFCYFECIATIGYDIKF